MAAFNVCMVRWSGPVPYFEAYREVAATVAYALRSLGHDSAFASDRFLDDRINILFGFQLLDPKKLARVPPNTIFYNLEQVVSGELKPVIYEIKANFAVWDYSSRNCAALRRLGASRVWHVPIGYVPELRHIAPAPVQDIDVLFYGLLDDRRRRILSTLSAAGLTVETLVGIYGAVRDQYIARAKVVLNLHLYQTHIFEVVRVSYLLANAKAVVSEYAADTEIEDDFRSAVWLADESGLVDACRSLVADEAERRSREERGFAIMSARDEREYLRRVLVEMGLGS